MRKDKIKSVSTNERPKGFILSFFHSFIFIIVAWYFLYVRNADTMFFMQDRGGTAPGSSSTTVWQSPEGCFPGQELI